MPRHTCRRNACSGTSRTCSRATPNSSCLRTTRRSWTRWRAFSGGMLAIRGVVKTLSRHVCACICVFDLVFRKILRNVFSCRTFFKHLPQRSAKTRFIRIDGQVAQGVRHSLVQSFQNDSDVRAALLSIKAAGVGLTLTVSGRVLGNLQTRARTWRHAAWVQPPMIFNILCVRSAHPLTGCLGRRVCRVFVDARRRRAGRGPCASHRTGALLVVWFALAR